MDEMNVGTCQWCGKMNVEIRPYRDTDEGHNGQEYDVCIPCIKADSNAKADPEDFIEDDEE